MQNMKNRWVFLIKNEIQMQITEQLCKRSPKPLSIC